MDVVLTIGGQVKVNDERNLLHIDTTGQQIGCDQNTRGTRAELTHNDVTLTLVHISVHARDGEVTLLHLLLEPVNLATGVAVDDGLRDGKGLVQITKCIQLPLFPIHSNVELLDTLKSQLILLDKDTNGIPHETLSHLQHIQGHGSREKAHLHGFRKEFENVIDLILESPRQHLISLIQEELPNRVQSQSTAVDHIIDTSGGTNNDVHTSLECTNIVTNGGTTDAGVNLKIHVITEGDDDLLDLLSKLTGGGQYERLALTKFGVKLGESSNGKGGSFTL